MLGCTILFNSKHPKFTDVHTKIFISNIYKAAKCSMENKKNPNILVYHRVFHKYPILQCLTK